ncbi:unnamed protein product [Periconia digitata]|uniref:Uncharacterized protein n=1 Tax=Periconia digitata TaxID=1303443 RepID=A0A9W4UJU1_9PLEO|nr:unnamed protein product [Periconia digitata]
MSMIATPVFILVSMMVFAEAIPLRRIQSRVPKYDEHPSIRTLVVVLGLIYVFILAIGQGLRCGRLGRRMKSTVIEVLVLAQFLSSISFIMSVAILESGLGIQNDDQCHATIRVCIAMYLAGKITLYLFLLERVHIVRAPFVHRLRDPLWVIGMITITGGLGGITIYEYRNPLAELSYKTGLCRIGIVPGAGVAIMTMDILIGTVLTGIFIWIMKPSLRSMDSEAIGTGSQLEVAEGRKSGGGNRWSASLASGLSRVREKRQRARNAKSARDQLKAMLWRNIIGSSIALAGTLANNIIYLTWKDATRSYACLLGCMTDVVISMWATNWMTMGDCGENRGMSVSAERDSGGSNTTQLTTAQSRAEDRGLFSGDDKIGGRADETRIDDEDVCLRCQEVKVQQQSRKQGR